MKIDKDTILDLIKQHVGGDKAAEAARELPDEVDTEADRGLLAKFGIDADKILDLLPGDLVDKLPGGIGKKLGDLL